ncbi:MAG: OmpA family protein [Pseudomonadota bacterium]
MIKLKSLALATTFGIALSVMSISAMAEGDMVNNYVKSAGGVVKNSYGECWRSRFEDTTEKLEECGYEPPAPIIIEKEIVIAPAATAATVTTTVFEDIAISAALLFGFDSADLSDDAKAVIDERVEKFKGKAELTQNVSVIGHTDSTGPEAYNQKLSERRAQAVATYLEANTNISDNQIDVEGKGESDPAASNATRDGRSANRRVIIHVEGKVVK